MFFSYYSKFKNFYLIIFLSIFSCLCIGFDWEEKSGYRKLKLSVPAKGKAGFTSMPITQIGVRFTNQVSSVALQNRSNLMNGSGVALGDVNGDGLCDVYFCRLEGANELYLNQGGFRFALASNDRGVSVIDFFSRGASFVDIDGDEDLDLLLTTFRNGTRCLVNDGNGYFKDITNQSGLKSNRSGTSLALGDVDGDNDLDLYVSNYGEIALLRDGGDFDVQKLGDRSFLKGSHASRLKIVNEKLVELGEADDFYQNNGQGLFRRVPWEENKFLDHNGNRIVEPMDFGLTVQIRDINSDGLADIYVCNDFQTPDRLWLNNGIGTFREAGPISIRSVSYASRGVDFSDIDNNGEIDFFVTGNLARNSMTRLLKISPNSFSSSNLKENDIVNRLQVERNTMFWNRGDKTFSEVGRFAGVEATDWSWQPVFIDIDLDGYEDLFITNGQLHDINDRDAIANYSRLSKVKKKQAGVLVFPAFQTSNFAYRNLGNFRFSESTQEWGINSLQTSHGIAVGDLDNDGDMDLVINCLNQPALIYRNNVIAPRIAVRLKGLAPNTAGIGGRITVAVGNVLQTQEVTAGGRYLSGDQEVRTFAIGGNQVNRSIKVTWPNGQFSFINNPEPNCLYEVIEPVSISSNENKFEDIEESPFFEDASGLLNYTHSENLYDDTLLQPLLTRCLDRSGPGLGWFDYDGDGDEDLFIGASSGASVSIYQNFGEGKFGKLTSEPGFKVPGDVVSVCGWVNRAGSRQWLAAISNYESPQLSAQMRSYRKSIGISVSGKLLGDTMPGPIAVADIDADGDLDVFVGGRTVTGHYPQASVSALLVNNEDGLDFTSCVLSGSLGIVNGAVFSDLDMDGFPDLIITTEWGPIRVFKNQKGKFVEITDALGLSGLTGLWQGVATGDFDGNGKIDIVATNWGLNTSFKPNVINPPRLYYHFAESSIPTSLILGVWNDSASAYLPTRNLPYLFKGYSGLRGVFTSYRDFASAGVLKISDYHVASQKSVTAAILQSMVFLNNNERFEAKPLHPEAQLAPAFGVSVGDLDGDGLDDLFLAQNFSSFPTNKDRNDAGRGLWLRGAGNANFTPVRGEEAGIAIYGDQRGSALADYDEDGKLDLIVAQNNGLTKLFRNNKAKPGLRVRLASSKQNPDAIGSAARLLFGSPPSFVRGTWREWQLGSGYGSQDGLVKVFPLPETPIAIEVKWPGGKVSVTSLPAGLKEVTIGQDGRIINQKTK